MALSDIEIPISDHFEDTQGRLPNYDAYDATQRDQLRAQRHADIRCFVEDTVGTALSMSAMDAHDMDYFSDTDGAGPDTALAMSDLASVTVIHQEQWDGGTVGPQSDRNYWNGISIPVPTGAVTVTSLTPTVDLTAFAATDTLSLALPSVPAGLDLANSYVDFTSNVNGNFSVGPTVTVALSGLSTGDQELSAAMSVLAPLGYVVTAVRFRLTGTSPCTFRCLAIRALASTWEYAPLDVNTLTGRVVRPVSRDGSAGAAVGFPANAFVDPQVPTDWPILLRADDPSSFLTDPRPIDISEAAVFYTGAKTDGELRLYFREFPYDLVTQLELDIQNLTQAQLDALGHQLDFDKATYRARLQLDINTLPQTGLDGRPMYDIDAQPDYFTVAWVEVDLTWATGSQTLTIRDTEGNLFSYTSFALAADTRYVLFVNLEDDAIRVRIYPVSDLDVVDYGTTVLDSTLIRDDFIFSRRSGRVGWYARFADGDAYLDSLRAYSANFAEYRSVPLHSISPVVGGQIFYGGSSSREYFAGVEEIGSATVTPDSSKSASGECYRVDLDGAIAGSGLTTNRAPLDNFGESVVSFDLLFPSEAYNAGNGIDLYLTDAYNRAHALNPGKLYPDQWHSYRISLEAFDGVLLPGYYQLNIALSGSAIQTAFYVDNLSIRQPVLVWSGRGQTADPWADDRRKWIEFREAVNGQTAGALFPERGNSPQVRALARRQNATLSSVRFIPKYAPLGRFVWSDQAQATQDPVVGAFTATDVGSHTASFTPGTVTLKSGNRVVFYEWSFGDGGSAAGELVTHTYASAGTYPASLTVVDNQGRRATHFQNVTVA